MRRQSPSQRALVSGRNQPVLRCVLLKNYIVCRRYVEQEQDSRRYPGGPGPGALEELREACRGAMRYAQKYNAYVEECGGQAALIHAWQAFIEITFTRR